MQHATSNSCKTFEKNIATINVLYVATAKLVLILYNANQSQGQVDKDSLWQNYRKKFDKLNTDFWVERDFMQRNCQLDGKQQSRYK